MGVLKVNVGTVAVPDWRKVGCGGGATGEYGYATAAYPTTADTVAVYSDGVTVTALTNQLGSAAGIMQIRTFSGSQPNRNAVYVTGDRMGGHAVFQCPAYDAATLTTLMPGELLVDPAFRRSSSNVYEGNSTQNPITVQGASASTAATTGRLKLWDGTQWLKEACDSGASDDFNRTASTLGVTSGGALPWSVLLGAWETTGSVARSTATGAFTGGGSAAVAVVDAGVADTVLTLTVYNESGTSGTDPSGIAFRAVDGQNFLLAYVTGLYKISGGTFSVLATWTTVPSGGVLGVTLNGSTITVTGNGTSTLASVTETFQQTATKHGIYGGQVGAQMDDFTLGAPVTGHPLKVNIGTADAPDWVVAACMTPV